MMAQTIVKNLDVFENVELGLGPGGILAVKDQFSFEHAKKAFGRSIIITITFATYGNGTEHLGFGQ